MGLKEVAGAAGALIVLAAWCGTAAADETGFADIHSHRREGGRMCFDDHWHYGGSTAQPNKKMAMAEAIKSWVGFVDLEYGSTWANYQKSAGRKVKCEQGASGWSCDIEARPCR
jgi:hypothetical protein